MRSRPGVLGLLLALLVGTSRQARVWAPPHPPRPVDPAQGNAPSAAAGPLPARLSPAPLPPLPPLSALGPLFASPLYAAAPRRYMPSTPWNKSIRVEPDATVLKPLIMILLPFVYRLMVLCHDQAMDYEVSLPITAGALSSTQMQAAGNKNINNNRQGTASALAQLMQFYGRPLTAWTSALASKEQQAPTTQATSVPLAAVPSFAAANSTAAPLVQATRPQQHLPQQHQRFATLDSKDSAHPEGAPVEKSVQLGIQLAATSQHALLPPPAADLGGAGILPPAQGGRVLAGPRLVAGSPHETALLQAASEASSGIVSTGLPRFRLPSLSDLGGMQLLGAEDSGSAPGKMQKQVALEQKEWSRLGGSSSGTSGQSANKMAEIADKLWKFVKYATEMTLTPFKELMTGVAETSGFHRYYKLWERKMEQSTDKYDELIKSAGLNPFAYMSVAEAGKAYLVPVLASYWPVLFHAALPQLAQIGAVGDAMGETMDAAAAGAKKAASDVGGGAVLAPDPLEGLRGEFGDPHGLAPAHRLISNTGTFK